MVLIQSVEYIFCSSCGTINEVSGNLVSSGDHSNSIAPNTLNIKRHQVNSPWLSNGKVVNRSSILKLGTWGSHA
ncbi:putative orphan protein [Pseudoalteromonas translucida]|uniref:Orphan protein n=1 Tax=Pseudoalteromonas translucida (strain TAC 125) TaxID=326442 RepID=Q3IBZ2_PSET1|nr:putative orphan protein [Pseudoalteromonas translucida]